MLEYRIDFYQNLLTITILIISYIIIAIVGIRNKRDIVVLTTTFLWHTFFSIYYFVYSLSNTADAKSYYIWSLTRDSITIKPGTSFITYLTTFFSKGLDASYLNSTLFFNIFGSLGIVFLYLSLKKFISKLVSIPVLILLIPSMSFWSAGLGKDSIAFMAACLFLYAITTSRKIALPLSLSFISMFMVRPHIAAVMLLSFVIYFILKSKVHIILKALFIPIILVGLIIALKYVQQYVGLDEASLDTVDSYLEQRQSYNRSGGSSLDISSMSYPMQMFTYIFRPLPFEAHSIVALITSIENTILLLSFIYITIKSRFNFSAYNKGKNLWLFLYVFITCSMLAITTANLGIATRQKWMFMPILVYLLLYAFNDYKIKRNKVYP